MLEGKLFQNIKDIILRCIKCKTTFHSFQKETRKKLSETLTFHLFHLEVKTLSSSSNFLLFKMSCIYIHNKLNTTTERTQKTRICVSTYLQFIYSTHIYLKVGLYHQFACHKECKIAYFIMYVSFVLYLFLYSYSFLGNWKSVDNEIKRI